MNRLIAIGLLSAAAMPPVFAQTPIKIGEINSYSAIPQFTQPYKQGWQLAIEEINAQGGLLGRKVEVISRDDNANPGDAVRVAEELVFGHDKVSSGASGDIQYATSLARDMVTQWGMSDELGPLQYEEQQGETRQRRHQER